MRLAALIGLTITALAAFPAASAARVDKGAIQVGRGGAGITLDMTRAQVVAKLGRPRYENHTGFMEFGRSPNLFDVYLDVSSTPKRVRLIGISGERFCFSKGFCMYDRRAVGKLRTRFAGSLELVTLEDGERIYRVRDAYLGCPVFTDFTPARLRASARIIMVFVGFESGTACTAPVPEPAARRNSLP
jgi:hypothetical protein